MKTLKFGIEIETVGLGWAGLAAAIQKVVGGTTGYIASGIAVTATDGRVWSVVRDGSLSGSVNGEIVSPVLTYADLETLQNVVREVRQAGARVDSSCGIHVHVGAENFDARAVTNLINIMNKHELILEKALGVSESRLVRYCKRVDATMMQRLQAQRPRTLAAMNRVWYGQEVARPQRYDSSRYHALNLNGFFVRKTVEFRLFNGSLHAGEVKSYIQLCLALAAKAMKAKSTSGKKRPFNPASGRYDMRVILLGLGLIGDEFATARHHLTKRLGGSSAWKNGRPAPAAPAQNAVAMA
jgi:Putative amidoligase enzyme